ncbi:MAG: hypothetical protein BM564_07960 [Bacteroidetes bacterium MedPE-SWsnd-G2]|nr:MAG: hypothetical protein BM564_07960 [Bacteroidetes bacterium MedPE-SWsnd-G2]
MSGILDLIQGELGKSVINNISQASGEENSKTNSVLTMAIPVLLQAMKNNSKSEQGSSSLQNALNKHDGSLLDNLDGFFGGGVDDSAKTDGSKILGHILGQKQNHVEQALSTKSGVNSSSVSEILKIAAPIVMNMLGKQNRESSASSVTDVLSGLLGNNSQNSQQGFLEQMLDSDGDGSVIDDVAGMLLGGNKKSDGLGGIIGNIFGKK